MNRVGALCFAAAILVVTADRYDSLSPEDKKLTNQLIEIANEKFAGSGKHLDYSEQLEDTYGRASLRILLKPTTCRRSNKDLTHRPHCAVRENANPQIDCIACDGNFVDCQRQLELWKTEAIREQYCGVHRIGQYGVALSLPSSS